MDTCWKIIRGGGSIIGQVDAKGRLTGDNIAYLYPDFKTALVGKFDDGILVEAREAFVKRVFKDEAGILVPEFSEPIGEIHFR